MCVLVHSVTSRRQQACLYVCVYARKKMNGGNYNHPYYRLIIRTHCSQGPSYTCWVLRCLSSLAPSISSSPSPCVPLPFSSSSCCVHMTNSEQMRDALSALFWKVPSQVRCKLNISCPPHLSRLFVPLIAIFFSPILCITVLTPIFLSLSPLSGGAGGECDSHGGRYGRDLLPPAELRWIDRGHPESPPTDPLLQRHTRCVRACPSLQTDLICLRQCIRPR